jgi:glutaconate CoA-transferase subunit A
MSQGKVVPLNQLAELIPDGASLVLGGSFLHRGPFALVRSLVRQGRRDLELIKASPGYDVDLLCRAGALRRVRAGIVAMEAGFGLAAGYRRAIERGEVELEEHACMSLVAGLRAAAAGVPFQPVAGLHGSELPKLNGWQSISDPYGSGAEVYLIPAIRPDFAVIHANEVDEQGNARVFGSPHWDLRATRSARQVLVTAEKLVSGDHIRRQPELTLVPGFMVRAVSIVPGGAWPGSMHPYYGIDRDAVARYVGADDGLEHHLDSAPEQAGVEHAS